MWFRTIIQTLEGVSKQHILYNNKPVNVRKFKIYKGSIALTAVIIITGILTIFGIAVVLSSADVAISAKYYEERLASDSLSRSCLEESLYRIKGSTSFVGTFAFSNGTGSCDVAISDEVGTPGVKIITVDTSVDGSSLDYEYRVDVGVSPFEIL